MDPYGFELHDDLVKVDHSIAKQCGALLLPRPNGKSKQIKQTKQTTKVPVPRVHLNKAKLRLVFIPSNPITETENGSMEPKWPMRFDSVIGHPIISWGYDD